VLSLGEALNNPQVQARRMVVEVNHSRVGRTRALGTPVKFSKTPTQIRRAAPVLGEHTREILGEFGYGEAEINQLVTDGDIIAM
jgi:crotonobetainyl-CoA:carnitine CoA-transferase CaiB-like acyl-CoA transferase